MNLIQGLCFASFTFSVIGTGLISTPVMAAPPGLDGVRAAILLAPPSKLPPGSFVKEPTRSIEELNRHIQKNPKVAERYAKLIKMSPEMIRLAFSKLRLTTLKENTYLDVYYCRQTKSGDVIGHKRRLVRKGTKIFATEDGLPVMIQICGNPTQQLRDVMPRLANRINPDRNTNPPVLDETQGDVPAGTPDIALNPDESVLAPDDFVPVPQGQLVFPQTPSLPPTRLAQLSTDTLRDWVRNIPRGSNPALTGLGSLLGLGGLVYALNSGSNPSSTNTTGTNTTGNNNTGTNNTGTNNTGTTNTGTNNTGTTTNGGADGGVIPEPNASAMALIFASGGVGIYLFRRTRTFFAKK